MWLAGPIVEEFVGLHFFQGGRGVKGKGSAVFSVSQFRLTNLYLDMIGYKSSDENEEMLTRDRDR